MAEQNPKCPSCGRRMALKRRPASPSEQHTFACDVCHVVFMTEDHDPASGEAL